MYSDFAVLTHDSQQHAPTRDPRQGPADHATGWAWATQARAKAEAQPPDRLLRPLTPATRHIACARAPAPRRQRQRPEQAHFLDALHAANSPMLSGDIHVTLYTLSPNSTCTRWEWNIWINTGSCSPRASYSRRVTLAATHAWACDRESDDWTTHDTRATQVWSAK